MIDHKDRSALEILGSPDDLKFRSCLTAVEAVEAAVVVAGVKAAAGVEAFGSTAAAAAAWRARDVQWAGGAFRRRHLRISIRRRRQADRL
jgi:hypothetical protein